MNITGGKYNGRKLIAPASEIARPTLSKVRMGVFNTLFSIVGQFEKKSFLDVFGGSGIMGLEAISRGFDNVLVFEKNFQAVKIIKDNYKSLGLVPNIKIGDSTKLIKTLDTKFDVIYVDPPYENEEIYNSIVAQIAYIINIGGVVAIEHTKPIIVDNLTLYRTKNYGGKKVSFYLHLNN